RDARRKRSFLQFPIQFRRILAAGYEGVDHGVCAPVATRSAKILAMAFSKPKIVCAMLRPRFQGNDYAVSCGLLDRRRRASDTTKQRNRYWPGRGVAERYSRHSCAR